MSAHKTNPLTPALSHPMGEGENNHVSQPGKMVGPGAPAIRAAYQVAQEAAGNAVQKALICGQLMLEQREAMGRVCHDDKPSTHSVINGRNQHSEGESFLNWLSAECPEIQTRTAYRWMEAAARVSTATIGNGAVVNCLTIEARESGRQAGTRALMPLSQIWATAGDKLPKAERTAKQLLLDFSEHNTLKDLMVLDGGSGDDFGKAALGAVRAVNGRAKGGTHDADDRCDFAAFIAREWQHVCTNASKIRNDQQRGRAAITAETALKLLPRWYLAEISSLAGKEARLTDDVRNDVERKRQAKLSLQNLSPHGRQ